MDARFALSTTLALALPGLACTQDGSEADAADELADSSESGSDDGEPWEPILARGDIEISSVTVNQGVEIPITVLGEWVGAGDRNSIVVANRDTLFRAYWTYPEDWSPREITAVLTLSYADGTEVEDSLTKMIDAPSFAGDITRSFTFPLLADQVPPGVEYHVELWEAGPGFDDERESTSVIESPVGGPEAIGVQPEPLELRVIVVPVQYEIEGCVTDTTELTPAQEQRLSDYLFEQNPVTSLDWEFRRESPILWDTELGSLAELWQPLQDLRVEEAAPPNTYYFALVDPCSGGVDGAGGIAAGIPPGTKDAAFQRTSTGIWIPDNEDFGYETYVHETGHSQGRSHVFCEGGGAAGPDPSYPHDNGITNVWGFGIRLFQLHSPTASFDYMTYCNPTWVSDWTWTKTFRRIRTLTSWDFEGGEGQVGPSGEVMVGLLMPNGDERWWTTVGAREPEYFSSGQVAEVAFGAETVALPIAIEVVDDGTQMVTIQLPRAATEITAATRIDLGGQAHPIHLSGGSGVQAPQP